MKYLLTRSKGNSTPSKARLSPSVPLQPEQQQMFNEANQTAMNVKM